jgi:hypothetical protein
MVDAFEIELTSQQGLPIYRFNLDDDIFGRFACDTYLGGVIRGDLRLEKGWAWEVNALSGSDGGQYAPGFSIAVTGDAGRFEKHYGLDALRGLVADRYAPELVRRGVVEPHGVLGMRLRARSEPNSRPVRSRPARTLSIPAPVADERELPPAMLRQAEEGQLPVGIARGVLQEILGVVQGDLSRETGGALVGHLCVSDGVLWARIHHQLPAAHTEATGASLKFTARTWSSFTDSLSLRGRDETLLGWHHSHPFQHGGRQDPEVSAARDNAKEAAKASPNLFFSRQDLLVHELAFPNPWQVALVVDPVAEAGQAAFELFGWTDATVQPTGFTILHSGESDK